MLRSAHSHNLLMPDWPVEEAVKALDCIKKGDVYIVCCDKPITEYAFSLIASGTYRKDVYDHHRCLYISDHDASRVAFMRHRWWAEWYDGQWLFVHNVVDSIHNHVERTEVTILQKKDDGNIEASIYIDDYMHYSMIVLTSDRWFNRLRLWIGI